MLKMISVLNFFGAFFACDLVVLGRLTGTSFSNTNGPWSGCFAVNIGSRLSTFATSKARRALLGKIASADTAFVRDGTRLVMKNTWFAAALPLSRIERICSLVVTRPLSVGICVGVLKPMRRALSITVKGAGLLKLSVIKFVLGHFVTKS